VTTWAPVCGRLTSALVFAWAAFASDAPVRRGRQPARAVLVLAAVLFAVIVLIVSALGDVLPRAIDPGLSPDDATRPQIVGSPIVLGQQIISMALFALAALGFLRRAQRTGEELSSWLAVAAVLGAFARLNYFLFPSLYSEWVYTGDFLRLGFFALLCAGAVREIVRAQDAEALAAVLEDRRRMAREIHDGLAQELSFIATHTGRLGPAGRAGGRPGAAHRPDLRRGTPRPRRVAGGDRRAHRTGRRAPGRVPAARGGERGRAVRDPGPSPAPAEPRGSCAHARLAGPDRSRGGL
jgi:signal transduction histidine kinase